MTQAEAQGLIQVLKKILQHGKLYLPCSGSKAQFELCSVFSDKDRFTVFVNRVSTIRKDKYTLLLRYGKDKGLLRIDIGGPDHTNPDGTIVPCPQSTFRRKTLEHGMLGLQKFRQYLEMLKTELKLSRYFFNTAMLTILQA